MVQLRPLDQNTRFRRDAWLEINLENLEFNLKQIHSRFNKPLIPVLKADAYGHGAAIIARILDNYDFIHAYAVASIDEALTLRRSTEKKIIILGVSPQWAIEHALESDIELTVVDLESAENINRLAKDVNKIANVHIKFDTGMNRIGFKSADAIQEIEKMENLRIETLFTHFADPSDASFTQAQYKEFEEMISGLDYPKHPASSQAARIIPDLEADYVRCGIELYGLENPELKPLMSLFARISFIKDIKAGESVSYKRTWKATTDTRIATLPLGYADGVPRALSNKIYAYSKNKKIKQVGTITMDQIMFDIGDNDINVGDTVELIGPNITISEWTEKLDTISYELVSALNLRLPKSYTRS